MHHRDLRSAHEVVGLRRPGVPAADHGADPGSGLPQPEEGHPGQRTDGIRAVLLLPGDGSGFGLPDRPLLPVAR